MKDLYPIKKCHPLSGCCNLQVCHSPHRYSLPHFSNRTPVLCLHRSHLNILILLTPFSAWLRVVSFILAEYILDEGGNRCPVILISDSFYIFRRNVIDNLWQWVSLPSYWGLDSQLVHWKQVCLKCHFLIPHTGTRGCHFTKLMEVGAEYPWAVGNWVR